jgi:hypothetical protein
MLDVWRRSVYDKFIATYRQAAHKQQVHFDYLITDLKRREILLSYASAHIYIIVSVHFIHLPLRKTKL